jgi:phosphate-selective porin OprO/OprP
VGDGYADQSDIWGFVVMSFYDISTRSQLLLRYTMLESTDANGVRLGRYEREIEQERGDAYSEIYGGLNVYFYGHKLKWQTGLQYTDMNDEADDGGAYNGWGLTSALRMSW